MYSTVVICSTMHLDCPTYCTFQTDLVTSPVCLQPCSVLSEIHAISSVDCHQLHLALLWRRQGPTHFTKGIPVTLHYIEQAHPEQQQGRNKLVCLKKWHVAGIFNGLCHVKDTCLAQLLCNGLTLLSLPLWPCAVFWSEVYYSMLDRSQLALYRFHFSHSLAVLQTCGCVL